ncbi:MAG TPA: class I SAM-dependent methyltransferase [Kineosporiaceae bacterium]
MSTPGSAHGHHRITGRLHGGLHGAHAGMCGLAGHARWYASGPGRLARRLYRRIAADVAAAGLPDGAIVLDVGTGPGVVPRLIARQNPGLQVEGVDLAEAMIDCALRDAAAEGLAGERLRYRVADVAALPHPDASVDLVVSSLSLHHWADVPAGLREVRRVLRPGAEAWIYDVRWVLGGARRALAAQGIEARLEPLARGPLPWRRPAALLAALGGRLIAQLTFTGPAA